MAVDASGWREEKKADVNVVCTRFDFPEAGEHGRRLMACGLCVFHAEKYARCVEWLLPAVKLLLLTVRSLLPAAKW